MTITVKRIGGSLAVVIPRAIAVESGLAEGTALEVSHSRDGILFRRHGQRPRRSIAKLLRQMDPKSYARRSSDHFSDPPVGKEID